ncbi:hypothetical protein D3C86_1440080 [compost metagenome]
MGDEGVGVGAGIDAIAARPTIGVIGNRLFDFRDQLFRFRAVNGHHLARHVGIPVGVRCITIMADRRAPAHLVVTVIGRSTGLFQHDPGVAGDGALEATGHGGKDVDRGFSIARRHRQHAGGRPSCGVPAARMVLHGP